MRRVIERLSQGWQGQRPAVLLLALALAVFAGTGLVSDFRIFQLNLTLVWVLAIMGLNLLTGYGGQISLGHGAFYAVGAYTTAMLMTHAGWSGLWTLPFATMTGGVLGVLMGFPALRLSGLYLALVTFALANAVPQLLKFQGLQAWTGGVQGLVLSKPEVWWSPVWMGVRLNEDRQLTAVLLLLLVLTYSGLRNLLRSRMGRALVAVRDHPTAAAAMGIQVTHLKTLTFGLSAAITALAGAMGALVVAYVAPDSFPAWLSISLLVGVVVGGLGRLEGAVLGALFIQFVPNLSDAVFKSAPLAIYGALLLAVVYAVPEGLMGGLEHLRSRWRARQKPPASNGL